MTLEAGDHGFSVRFVGAVNIRVRKGKPDFVHRFGHGSHGCGGWRFWLGKTTMVVSTAASTGSAAATTLMGPAGRSSVMKLG